MIYVAAILALVVGFLCYLIWPFAGVGFPNIRLPIADKPFSFRYRPNSLLAKLLKRKGATQHQVVVCGVIHSSGYTLTEGQFLHELYHVLREKIMGWLRHVWRYLTSKLFRVTEEQDAESFQHRNRGLPEVRYVLDLLNQYGEQKRG